MINHGLPTTIVSLLRKDAKRRLARFDVLIAPRRTRPDEGQTGASAGQRPSPG